MTAVNTGPEHCGHECDILCNILSTKDSPNFCLYRGRWHSCPSFKEPEHDTRQRNVPEGERMYAIGEGDLCCIKMFIEDNANHDDEILDIVRNALLHPLSCMERNGARGQQSCWYHDHNVCPMPNKQAQPQDAAGKADLIPILMYCRNIINTDKSGLAMALDRIRRVAKGYAWIPLNEWGSYEYTERTTTTLQKEVGFMLQEIDNIADLALKESGERVNVHIREIEKGVAELRTTPASPGKASGDVLAELEQWIFSEDGGNCERHEKGYIVIHGTFSVKALVEKIAALRQVQQP